MASFNSLVRFRGEDGNVYYGEAGESPKHTKESLTGRLVPTFRGVNPWDGDFALNGEERRVAEVLCPLPATPIFMCVGLNYKQHAAEAKMDYGNYPVIFTKPPDALAGPFEDIPIPAACISMDYEAELCVVLGKDCKNLTADADFSEYILGYTAGNDVSSRWWQMPERSGNQHGSAKSFDKFAPIGPVITSPRVITDPADLRMECFVNGEKRQSTKIDDVIFDIPAILQHLSRGTTLRKGTIIMTGTPGGVAAFIKPPAWLKNGDVVEVHIDKIGVIRNKMVFEKDTQSE
ncbi:fumarylacetoacetate hydrolase family protein [Dactylonectria macrodidyma]|uniref:Fumarylacetoacetate hydrolase family protein n=1 Tax=Dactylonectria macrodidyma TaxID=307937 RepID=A0A9P9ERK7_9HYPO|nr:fumarylacetoacetate hydrolase family protein [Dactylonectria macrodidyma]